MRRFIAGVLFVTLLGQSSGASALAASTNTQPALAATFFALANPIHQAWLNSGLHAMLTGQLDRYAAMHAPRPEFPHVMRIAVRPDASRRHEARIERRLGRTVAIPGLHKPEAIDPRKAAKDPMAMRRSAVPGQATLSFVPRWNARGRFAARQSVAVGSSQGTSTTANSGVNPFVCPPNGCVNTPTPRPSPTPTPAPTPTPTPMPTPTSQPTPCPPGDTGIPPSCVTATPTPQPTPGLSPSTTGINHYWTYEEEPLPGIGKAMVNVGNGNLLVQVDDLDIPERGIDLALRRTYNSQSQHDAAGTDGSTPSVFGNGWTNTFDAHLAYNATYNIISVYDIDGARYDYTADGNGSWIPPAGQYAQLTSDGACGYYWTKKTGTAYYFEAPNQPSTCISQIPAGLAGRVLAIQGRNVNNSLTFSYSWANGNATNPENLAQIVVQHGDGQSLTLSFGLLNGSGPDELESVTRPDGASVSYEYDSSGDLIEVDRPGNSTTSAPTCSNTNTLCIPETYTYSNGYLLGSANSPRYTESQRSNGTAQEGDTVNVAFDGDNRVTSMTDYGVVNFTPQDGVSPGLGSQGILQSSYPTGLQSWYTESFSGWGSAVTTVSDSDGHSRIWTSDGLWRVTMTQEWTGSQWLVSYQQWDGNDNLIAFTDERDYVSTFAYDGNGNAIMEAQPQVTTSMGTFQPTSWYQYDQYNNLLYYCDPNWVHQQGGDYPNGSNPCTGTPSGVVHYVWSTGSTPEVYGQLTDTYTPLGYHHHLTYDANGMPLSVIGDSMTQADGTQRTPEQQFTYDSNGNLQTYNPGNGTWHLTYDDLNRVVMREDPDAVYSYVCYNADGSTEYTESSYQRQLDGGSIGMVSCSSTPPAYAVSCVYDADGNVGKETHHHGGTYGFTNPVTLPGTADITTKFYDADDRLVEVEQPYDSSTDLYQNPWITRYMYDLSQDGALGSPTFYGQSITANGNLYKTVELLPSGGSSVTYAQTTNTPPPPIPNTVYQETKGTSFDALDRPTAKYSIITASGSQTLSTESLTYDSSAALLGLLAQDCNAVGQCQSLSYDPRGSESEITFSDATPSRSMQYDPDGRTISVTSSTFGAQSYTYDADGRTSTSQDPSSGGLTSPALLTYHYYADGKEESLDVSSSALTQSGLFAYSYRTDGLTQTQSIDDANVSGIVNAGTTTLAYTYTSAGRMTERSESGAAANSTPRIITRNSNGQETGESFPSASLSSMEYDAEDALLGIVTSSQGDARYTYNARGELSYAPATPPANGAKYYANGTMLQVSETEAGVTWDDRMAVTVSSGPCGSCELGSGWIYDAAGRMTSETMPSGPSGNTTAGTARSYDAENHTLISDAGALPNRYPPNGIIQWGPNGHPIEIGTSTTTRTPTQLDTLHWDGSQLLFTTDYLGQVDDIKIGAQGDILPLDPGYNGLTFFDRDPSGTVMGCHNAGGAVFAGINDPFTVPSKMTSNNKSPCGSTTVQMPQTIVWWGSYTGSYYSEGPSGNGAIPTIGAGAGVLGMPRTDGYTDGLDTIQGVRTYDSNAGTWTTPDAYAGDMHDPASQESYMWDSNNPLSFSDPSGFCSNPGGSGTSVCIDAFIEQGRVMNGMEGDGRSFSADAKNDSFRVRVNIDFSAGRGTVIPGVSHYSDSSVAVPPPSCSCSAEVHGNVAHVHIEAYVGGSDQMVAELFGAAIRADFVITLNKDGSMVFEGVHSLFPSFEIVRYQGSSRGTFVYTYTEFPKASFGPAILILWPTAVRFIDITSGTSSSASYDAVGGSDAADNDGEPSAQDDTTTF